MKVNISYSEEDRIKADRLEAAIRAMFPDMRQKTSRSCEKYVHIYFADKSGKKREKGV